MKAAEHRRIVAKIERQHRFEIDLLKAALLNAQTDREYWKLEAECARRDYREASELVALQTNPEIDT